MLNARSIRWTLALVCTSLFAVGCSTTTDTPSGETGAVSLNLELAPGVEINEVDWVLTSPGMDPMSGTINTSAPGATASVEVFGLPPGDDYNVALMATSEDGSVTCGGDADFEVEVGETTPIMVMLNCKRPERLGGVRVNGKFNICADLAKVIVSPLQTSVGKDIDLFAAAVDVEGDTIKYVWSGMGGIIDDPNDPTTTYTCGTVGIHEITIAVTDDDMEYCVDKWTVPVRCVEGDVDLCEGEDCSDGNECTADRCNPATGECINADVEDGTKCDLIGIGDGVCEAGECVEVDLCEGVDCSDGNECTLDLCDDETGNCSNPPVDDGTECNNGDGMCFEGQCRDIDRCEDVICEPTLNDCTVGICNMDSGECDIVNRPDGTECNGGAGSCSAGECVDDNLCDGVDCSSDNDCVADGACDPADGECIPGNDLPEGVECDLIGVGDGFCDGAGTCVDCNEALDCGPAPQCFVPTCVDNTCGEQAVPDGTECDLIGTGDGVCDAGECVEPPECISPGDCPDMVCSSKDCVAGACTYLPTDGASCEVEPGLPGTCDGMTCVGLCDGVGCSSNDECVEDGTCDEQSGECIPGDPQQAGFPCSQNGGSVCDGAGTCVECNVDQDCTGGQVCIDGTCVSSLPPPQTALIINSCALPSAVSGNLVPFPAQLSVTPTSAAVGGGTFSADLDPSVVLDQAFLQTAAVTLFEGFSLFLTEVNLTVAQVEMASKAGCSEVCVGGSLAGTACSADVDCDADGVQPYEGQCIGPTAVVTPDDGPLPRVLTVPNEPWPCATDAQCEATNSLGSGTCQADNTCDPTTVPTQVTGGVVLDNFSPVSYSCSADASGTIALCTTGLRSASVGPTDPATETFVKVDVGSLTNVGFDCEAGSSQNPAECVCPAPGGPCPNTTECAGAGFNFCITDPGVLAGNCAGPSPSTLKYDPLGSICSPQDANAGVACLSDLGCDAACDLSAVPDDPQAGLCSDGSACAFPNADDQCLGTGGGTCIPACVTYPIL